MVAANTMVHSIRSHPSDEYRSSSGAVRPLSRSAQEKPDAERERVVLAGVILPSTKADLSDPLGELTALAESAGVDVVDAMVQKRTALHNAHALGKGRLAELAERVEANRADTVVFDNDLSPRQIRAIEKAVQRKIIDRSELILDIFASHAKTRESQIQVELAQLQYTAPRLRGMWTHLERIAGAGGGTAVGAVGGVGTRGPGERQIEIDRRIVRDRIAYLKKEIAKIDRRKLREVRSRSDEFTVSLVGYTNAGKSTLMNHLTDAGQWVADQLFATLDTKTVRWDLGGGHSALLSDTVGFVRDIPHHLVASFRATLEEAIHANLLLIIVDVSSPTAWQQFESVNEVLSTLGCDAVPRILLLNKIDVASDAGMAEMLACHSPGSIRISALNGEGTDILADEIRVLAHGESTEATVAIPQAEGKLLSEIERVADVRGRRYTADMVELDVCMNRSRLEQLCGRYPAMKLISVERPEDANPPE
ncbi:MAG: GTPase HflX [Planctomycetes bacterium]|nr:GTPase HflX [Planctomycetota bacterium]